MQLPSLAPLHLLIPVALMVSSACEVPADPSAFGVDAGSADTPSAACDFRNPLRRAWFGDLHVHTALSADAWNYDLAVRPTGAYAYGFGRPIEVPMPGGGTRTVQIDRPLDFVAVTDHAEFLGEQRLCSDPDSGVYESDTCTGIRESTTPMDSPLALKIMNPWVGRNEDVCGEDDERCDAGLLDGWHETIEAAEQWNDTTSACTRTAFIGYEYSSFRLGSNLHRNVIFRNSIVPRRPISFIDVQREWELWRLLRDGCIESGTGCDALAIPHNSNISNGRMFSVDYIGAYGIDEQAERARLRAALEPIVEIMQHKGDSECRADVPDVLGATDELCDFEKLGAQWADDDPGRCYDGPLADGVPHLGPDCLSHRSYVRYALTEGLREQERIGVNPFKVGLSASTDTHNAMAGGVAEKGWVGHLGIQDGQPAVRLASTKRLMGNTFNGPGGLIGVWAEENSRTSLFDAMRRREVFGTSGPRIRPRFYGTFVDPGDVCGDSNVVARADAAGVAMGSDLPDPAGASAPIFIAYAERDTGTDQSPGGLLQRIQIIKGWVDTDGALHQEVIDVAGSDNGARVDPRTCAVSGEGYGFLCGVWTDPDFDPQRPAVYYARVLENPSCRYSGWECASLQGERPSGCDDPRVEHIIQERAWTSPIWYTPAS
jgi:hypothetical protein